MYNGMYLTGYNYPFKDINIETMYGQAYGYLRTNMVGGYFSSSFAQYFGSRSTSCEYSSIMYYPACAARGCRITILSWCDLE